MGLERKKHALTKRVNECILVNQSPIIAWGNERHSPSKLEMSEPRHLLCCINVQPGAAPPRLTLQNCL